MIILEFLLKLIISSGVLYGYYWCFLRDKKFHRYNRYYLLSILVVTPAISLLKIPVSFRSSSADTMLRTLDQFKTITPASEGYSSGSSGVWWAIGYSSISLLLVLLVLKSLWYIRTLRKKYQSSTIEQIRLYQTREPGTPFSFFQSVFWQEELPLESTEGQRIFRHEWYHVKQQHSADMLLAETITALMWINPFFHLVKKELKAIHEFLADQFAIRNDNSVEYASLLIQRILNSRQPALVHPFFQNHIKRRIAMITKPTTGYSYWSRLMALPIGITLIAGTVLYAGAAKTQVVSATVTPASTELKLTGEASFAPVERDTIPAKSKEKLASIRKDLEKKKLALRKSQEEQQLEIRLKETELRQTIEEMKKNHELSEEDLVTLKRQQEEMELQNRMKIEQENQSLVNLKLQAELQEKQQADQQAAQEVELKLQRVQADVNLRVKQKIEQEARMQSKQKANQDAKQVIQLKLKKEAEVKKKED